jgi:hypothetical protein
MGVRVFGDMRYFGYGQPPVYRLGDGNRVVGRTTSAPSSTPKFEFMYDGTGGKEGLPSALAANEAWLDPTYLVEPGLQFGISAMYVGAGAAGATIYGCFLPSDYARQKLWSTEAAVYVAQAATLWETIVSVTAAGGAESLDVAKPNIMYTLLRVVFNDASPGVLTLTSR